MILSLEELRLASRRLRRRPAFTAAALTTLAVAIGATTALFTVLHGVLLRPLPLPQGDRPVVLTRRGQEEADISIPDGEDLREQLTSMDGPALFLPFWTFDLVGDGAPRRLVGSPTEPALFRLLGVRPVVGRLLSQADDVPGGARVAVLREGFWRRQYGADPGIVGRTLSLNGQPVAVVGVVPDATDFLEAGIDLWVPAAVEVPWTRGARGTNNLEAVARLRDGVTLEEARTELVALTERLAEAHPRTNRGKILEPVPALDFLVGDLRQRLWLLQAAVGVVLLVACVNLAHLTVASGVGRQRELAVHLALGARRRRLAGAVLAESLLLAGAGGVLGLLVAWTGVRVLLAVTELPRAEGVALDPGVLAFAAVVSAGTALLFGVGPALWAARRDPALLLRTGATRSSTPKRWASDLLVIGQVALAMVLLVVSALLARTFWELRGVDPGFEAPGVVAANVVLPESRYGDLSSQTAAMTRVVEAVQALPGVREAAFVIGAPLADFGAIGSSLRFADRPLPPPGEEPSARSRPVLGSYFAALGIPVVRGRVFDERDRREAPLAAVVNQRFAEQYWPGDDPIGHRISWEASGQEPRWMEVVGVVADVRTLGPVKRDEAAVYTPWLQREPVWQRFGTLVARGPGEERGLVRSIRRAVWSVDPALPVPDVQPMEELLHRSLSRERLSASLACLFAVVAVVLAVQGLYGILAHLVAVRRREVGIRIALGARPFRVAARVVRRALLLVGSGILLGLTGAVTAARAVRGLLHGVQPIDTATYLAMISLLLAVTAAGATVPAGRAARADPLVALRSE